MFYSHEVLTNREYGVATIWLMATLGSKTMSKRVSRKEISGVDVPKACETILSPKVPMALRLQSNLLYGVSRVFSQQCSYVLTDAQTAQNNMKSLLKAISDHFLDSEAGRARPDNLVLGDDPAYSPDLDFATFELCLSRQGPSQNSSIFSPGSGRTSLPNLYADDAGPRGLVIPSSDFIDGGDVGGFDPIRQGSLPYQDVDLALIDGLYDDDEEELNFHNVDFELDDEGNIVELQSLQQRPASAAGSRRLGSEGSVSGRAGLRHAEAAKQVSDYQDDLNFNFDEDLPMLDVSTPLPDAEPFPQRTVTTSQRAHLDDYTPVPDESSSPRSVVAPARRQRAPARRALPFDADLELQRREVKGWQANYRENMTFTRRVKANHRAKVQAKKNAAFWVYGFGIGGAGTGIGKAKIPSPLDMFSGSELMKSLGITVPDQLNEKRAQNTELGDNQSEEGRRVRSRAVKWGDISHGDQQAERHDADTSGFQDDGIEIGRDAVPALEDISSQLPWNVSARKYGSSATRPQFLSGRLRASSSVAGSRVGSRQGSIGPQGIRRMTSASPLLKRPRRSNIERLSSQDLPGEDDGLQIFVDTDSPPGDDGFQLPLGHENMDTQETDVSKGNLDIEDNNFLDFISRNAQAAIQTNLNDHNTNIKSIIFQDLLPPVTTLKVAAAQGLLHVLTLATKDLMSVYQSEAFGPIELKVVATP